MNPNAPHLKQQNNEITKPRTDWTRWNTQIKLQKRRHLQAVFAIEVVVDIQAVVDICSPFEGSKCHPRGTTRLESL